MPSQQRKLLDVLAGWVIDRVKPDAVDWFKQTLARLSAMSTDKDIYLALGYTTRRLGKGDLDLTPDELAKADAIRPRFNPSDWSIDQAARIAFILASDQGDGGSFQMRLEQLFNTADIGELIAFYRGLPLYPNPERHVARAREGTRSAMQPIFEAVAYRNPYPREQFDENAWNHMVLKALFVGSRLAPIDGLDERANPKLMRMLCDYAHERWAAGRAVSPELWRCVGPHADGAAIDDLTRVLASSDQGERKAAVLALLAAPLPQATTALSTVTDLAKDAQAGLFDWNDIAP